MAKNKKYPGVDSRDTSWDEFHRSRGEMTNKEFFSSSGTGGFYEGMEYDEDEGWVPNAETRQREHERELKENECNRCGGDFRTCNCDGDNDW